MDRRAARERRRLRIAELHLSADDPGQKAAALADILGLELSGDSVAARRDARALPAGRAGGPAGARTRNGSPERRRLAVDFPSWIHRTATAQPVSRSLRPDRSSSDSALPPSRPGTGFGAFAGLHPLDDERLLAASTDGVGTKLIARPAARPASRLRRRPRRALHQRRRDVRRRAAGAARLRRGQRDPPRRGRRLVEGAAEVCRAAGVALIGGETAELPGIYAEGELDFAGTCVGVVDATEAIDGSSIEAGDIVVGFASAGVHANGFTSSVECSRTEDYDGDDLLAPTRLYLDVARKLRGRAKAFVHVTGGGLPDPHARAARRPAFRARPERLAPPVGLRAARTSRRRGRAPRGLQPRHRLVRGRLRAPEPDELVIGRIA